MTSDISKIYYELWLILASLKFEIHLVGLQARNDIGLT